MRIFIIIVFSLSIISCASYQSKDNVHNAQSDTEIKGDTIRIANDSLEYEVIVFEPGFESWLQTQKPRGFYSKSYLEQRNQYFVSIYNSRVYSRPRLYPQEIDYQPHIDYGYEVNYMLYHYFLFFEQKYNQKLR